MVNVTSPSVEEAVHVVVVAVGAEKPAPAGLADHGR